MNLYIEIELCIAQLGTQVRRLGTQVHGNILAVSISGAALPYSGSLGVGSAPPAPNVMFFYDPEEKVFQCFPLALTIVQ